MYVYVTAAPPAPIVETIPAGRGQGPRGAEAIITGMAPVMSGRMATTSIMPDGGAAAIGITERAATTGWTAAGASAAALAAGLLVFSAPAAAVVAGSSAVAPLAELHYRLDGRIVRVPVRLNGHALW